MSRKSLATTSRSPGALCQLARPCRMSQGSGTAAADRSSVVAVSSRVAGAVGERARAAREAALPLRARVPNETELPFLCK